MINGGGGGWRIDSDPTIHSVSRSCGRCTVDAHALACLCLVWMQFSEMRQVASWLHEALGCAPPGLRKEDECLEAERRSHPNALFPRDHHKLARCREELYSRAPYRSHGCALDISMHFEWKSFMWNAERDARFLERVRHEAFVRPSRSIIVLLGGGPHHMAKFEDHRQEWLWAVDDSLDWPQRWIDDYINGTMQLFRTFGRGATALPPRVCTAFRMSNIGPRHSTSNAPHHPSARNGLHDWLNRITAALASHAGLVVVDTTDVTIAHPPPLQKVRRDDKHAP